MFGFEIILFLLACLFLLSPIFIVILFVRLSKLEQKIQSMTTGSLPEIEETKEDELVEQDIEQEEEIHEEVSYSEPPVLFSWITTNWQMKLGAFLLFLAFVWFAKNAFMNDYIGPVGRITLGIMAGSAIMAFGNMRIQKYLKEGNILLGLGGVIVLLTTFAAREIHGFFTPASALGLMSLVIVFLGFVSVKNNTKALSIIALLFGGLAPILTSSPSTDFVSLFSYVLMLSVASLWVVRIKDWRELTLLALSIFGVYSFPYFASPFGETVSVVLTFAFVFAILFFAANISHIIRSNNMKLSDTVTAAMNGLLALGWIYHFSPEEYQSLLASFMALVFFSGAFAAFKYTQLKSPVYMYSGVCLTLLGSAVAFELSGAALVMTLVCLLVSFSAIAIKLFQNTRMSQWISVLLLIPGVLSLESLFSSSWKTAVMHEDFAVLMILMTALFLLGYVFYTHNETKDNKKTMPEITGLMFFGGSFYALSIIWLISGALLLNDNHARVVSLIIYTIIGLYFSLRGRFQELFAVKASGNILLLLVALRMLLIEVWYMSVSGRIVMFFLVGVLLIGSSFIKQKKI